MTFSQTLDIVLGLPFLVMGFATIISITGIGPITLHTNRPGLTGLAAGWLCAAGLRLVLHGLGVGG